MTHTSRRRVLKVVGLMTGVGAAGLFGALPRLVTAQDNATTAPLDDFIQVSQQLTERKDLSPRLGAALLLALGKTEKDLAHRLPALKALLQAQPGLLQAERLAFPAEHGDSEKLARVILGAWYEGVVGKGKQAQYVTYLNTLSNTLVSGKLAPPSFSYGPCGSWSRQP
ncbi:sugar dehydrogenase complex small subunit [Herbaspirillum seropedicae]|uniref:sugar dehydrogenase complex small subunit n=1 Tax=Herbaspirillum seropedicae TaxID=964 RepID=UPI003FCE6680